MAAILAFDVGAIGVQIDNPNIPHEQFNVGPPTIDQGIKIFEADAGANVSQQPITLATREIEAFIAPTYELDFYHRIWIIPATLNFGYVPSPQVREFHLWNAHRVSKQLDSIDDADATGLTLEADTPPVTYLPFEYRAYELEASPIGPPRIEATYAFTFKSGAEVLVLSVVGLRVVGWTFEPNWIEPVLERAAWLTDVQVSRDGNEQRRQLRGGPRVSYEFVFDVEGDARRLLENVLAGAGGRVFALPVWPDLRHLVSVAAATSTSIDVGDTSGTDFRADGLAVLLGPANTFEAVEVESIDAGVLTLKAPLENTWPAGTRVYPARASYMREGRGFAQSTRNYARGLARFETIEEVTRPELDEQTTYRGYPVMTHEPNWRVAPEIDYARKLGEIDYGPGAPFVFDHAGVPLPELRLLWTALDRAQANNLRAFLWARRGRQKALWVPTWADDLRIVGYENAVGLLDVAHCGIVDNVANITHRKDLRLELVDGTVLYRRITQAQEISSSTERLTLDTPLGQDLEAADFARVSWLMLLRLDQDAVEIAWHTPEIAETVLSLKGPNNVV